MQPVLNWVSVTPFLQPAELSLKGFTPHASIVLGSLLLPANLLRMCLIYFYQLLLRQQWSSWTTWVLTHEEQHLQSSTIFQLKQAGPFFTCPLVHLPSPLVPSERQAEEMGRNQLNGVRPCLQQPAKYIVSISFCVSCSVCNHLQHTNNNFKISIYFIPKYITNINDQMMGLLYVYFTNMQQIFYICIQIFYKYQEEVLDTEHQIQLAMGSLGSFKQTF